MYTYRMSTKTMTIYISETHHRHLRGLAEADNRPLGAEVETLIDNETSRRRQSSADVAVAATESAVAEHIADEP